MQGTPGVIQSLQLILRGELTGISQYFLHARTLAHWGITKLGKHEYEESIDEMKHADRLIKRILFLGGLPNLQELDKLLIGENVREILDCDLRVERKAVTDLAGAIAAAESARDFASRDLLQEILKDEEEHIDFIETQLHLIERIGLENFVQLQSDGAG